MTGFAAGDHRLNGAVLRVLGGVLIGIGIGPVVLTVLAVPIEMALGPVAAELFRPGIQFFAALLGVVVLHAVRLFYPGNWRSPEDTR